MGKASRWFRSIFGLTKKPNRTPSSQPGPSLSTHKQPKRKWSFAKSHNNKGRDNLLTETSQQHHHDGVVNITSSTRNEDVDPNKHAIAVAAATAAVAEAAVAAANAAAAVVILTSSGRATTNNTNSTSGGGGGGADSSVQVSVTGEGYGPLEVWAAVSIQSHFRAYLSRRALRALRSLVRLQALVRGYIARKQTADDIRRTQALLRIQARVRGARSQNFDSPVSVHKYIHPGPPTPEKVEHVMQARGLTYDGSMTLKRNGSKSNGRVINDVARARGWEHSGSSTRSGPIDDKRSDKILEIDTGKPHITPKRRNLFHSSHLSLGSEQYSQESTAHQSAHSPTSSVHLDDACYCTAESSPQFYSVSSNAALSNRGLFTPIKSECSRSCLSGYSDHPNYMSFTESSKAKMRSLSAPKQRPNYERSTSTKRHSIHNTQRVSALQANFANKAYPGSGRLDRLGMPVGGGDAVGFSGGHWNRF